MPVPNADRNMLIGILALQMDFIDRDQLIEAMGSWALSKSNSLDEILLEKNAIDSTTRDLILALVEKHLEVHKHDPKLSLKSLATIDGPIREALDSLNDASIEASLAAVGNTRPLVATDLAHEATTSFDVRSISEDLRFRILRPHAKGGLGKVSVALDTELNREVALKEIQEQLADQDESRSRFMLEAEITGGLEHPGIVPVYGLGTYSNGRPFYAMRFIKGDSLKEAADSFHDEHSPVTTQDFQSLEFRKILGRFQDVCNAIEYAHSRGVLHRDLKPGNIMLGKYGETLVVDWGLSKVVGRDDAGTNLDEPTLSPTSGSGTAPTQMGSTLGTPQYMSPEQAAGRLDQLGPASDVYSLGATLYYLLTKRAPFQEKVIEKLLRRVTRGEIHAPRTALPTVPRPLEAICLKAMSLETANRYSSPVGLANEIDSWLADEPVDAYPEPISARARRWVRHHQTQVVSALAVVLVGLISMAVILGVISESNRTLKLTNEDLDKANKELAEAKLAVEEQNEDLIDANVRIKQEEARVRDERDIAQAINNFVRNDMLGQASPNEEPERDITLRMVLDRSTQKIDARFAEQPAVRAAISHTIGISYRELGEFEIAERFLRTAVQLRETLPSGNPLEAINSKNSLALTLRELGRLTEAAELHEEVIESGTGDRRVPAADMVTYQANYALCLGIMGQHREATQRFEELFDISCELFGEESDQTINVMSNLAGSYESLSRFSEAEELYSQAIALLRERSGELNPSTLTVMSNLANLFAKTNRLDEAESLCRDVLEKRTSVLGESHRDTLKSKNILGSILKLQDRLSEAEVVYRDVLTARTETLGPEHPDTLTSISGLAGLLQEMDRYLEALPYCEKALELRSRALGENHPDTLKSMSSLANVYRELNRVAEAEHLYRRVLAAGVAADGQMDSRMLTTLNNLGLLLKTQGRLDEAEPIYEEVLERRIDLLGEANPKTLTSMYNLGALYFAQNRYDEAEAVFVRELELRSEAQGENHRSVRLSLQNLAGIFEFLGRHGDAIPLRERLVAAERIANPDSMSLSDALQSLSLDLLLVEDYEAAEPYCEECLRLREKHAEGSWSQYHAEFLLGRSLLGQSRFEDAEPFLLNGYEGMERFASQVNRRGLGQHLVALSRLVQLYESWTDPVQAQHWRRERAAFHIRSGVIARPLGRVYAPMPM